MTSKLLLIAACTVASVLFTVQAYRYLRSIDSALTYRPEINAVTGTMADVDEKSAVTFTPAPWSSNPVVNLSANTNDSFFIYVMSSDVNSVTFANGNPGRKFTVRWHQDAAGEHKLHHGSGIFGTCEKDISLVPGSWTDQNYQVNSRGDVDGMGCTTIDGIIAAGKDQTLSAPHLTARQLYETWLHCARGIKEEPLCSGNGSNGLTIPWEHLGLDQKNVWEYIAREAAKP